jgi:hypothetical protein
MVSAREYYWGAMTQGVVRKLALPWAEICSAFSASDAASKVMTIMFPGHMNWLGNVVGWGQVFEKAESGKAGKRESAKAESGKANVAPGRSRTSASQGGVVRRTGEFGANLPG